MADDNNPFQARYLLNPLYWPTWSGLALLWLSTRLPYRAIIILGSLLGGLSLLLMGERRRIARINIRLCFPDLSKAEQRRLLRRSFYSSGIALFESAWAWWKSKEQLKPLIQCEGLEHIREAQKHSKGVIILGAHYTTTEMGGRMLADCFGPFSPTYKRVRNKVFNLVMTWSRKNIYEDIIHSRDLRSVVKKLKQNKLIWYAPDQDFNLEGSVFAPFMGIPAATLTMTARLAKASGAPVLPMYPERLPGGRGYKLTIGPPLENFPGGNDVEDATAINNAISLKIHEIPEQYLWGHRRFKTRPVGEPRLYAHRRDSLLRRYTLLLALLSLPVVGYTLWMAYRNRDMAYLKQRFGLYPAKSQKIDLWFHAASVGEVIAVLPLILAIHKKHPQLNIALTTFTPTGGAIARKKLPTEIPHYYLPIDYNYAIQSVLNFLQPRCIIIMETELWPHLHQYCFNRKIPVIIINGRLSEKTYRSRGWIHHLICRSIEFSHYILARTEQDKQRFIEMHADEKKVEIISNIKFAIAMMATPPAINLGRRYILAASTHADEELRLARLWQKMNIRSHMLVIVPRHPPRGNSIMKQLATLNLNLSRRSKEQPVTDTTAIYLADTFGEVGGFIAGADFVFMGASLVKAGGHNILEVGAQGKAVIFGPSMYNFADERKLYLEHDAAIEVQDESELETCIRDLLEHPDKAASIGQSALQITQQQQHILQDYQDALERVCPPLAES